jgi:hypothetical protein
VGGAGDPRSDRAVGVGRPLASQARAPRLLYQHRVHVALDVLRVALRHQVVLPGEPVRPRPPKPPFPEMSWERNRIWIWDATHFTRAKRVAYAIVDVVTRYWIGYLLTSDQSRPTRQYSARSRNGLLICIAEILRSAKHGSRGAPARPRASFSGRRGALPLAPRERGEHEREHTTNGHDGPFERATVSIGIDPEHSLDPIAPHERQDAERGSDRRKREITPE